MRIAEKNIEFIKERTKDGTPYGYVIRLKDGTSYNFANYDDRNRTTSDEFKLEWLPKSMQKFMEKHPCVMWGEPDDWQGSVWAHYIYR